MRGPRALVRLLIRLAVGLVIGFAGAGLVVLAFAGLSLLTGGEGLDDSSCDYTPIGGGHVKVTCPNGDGPDTVDIR